MEKELKEFVEWCATHITGDEKGEAQTFLERFFVALGYKDGWKGAGAVLEARVRNTKTKKVSFADFIWKPRVLIEMKKRGEDLPSHLPQAFDYWAHATPNRPQYVILCNFDEFLIYDFNEDVYEPKTRILFKDLVKQRAAFNFLLPKAEKPLFNAGVFDITPKKAEQIGALYRILTKTRKLDNEKALHYCMQCIISLFADSIGLLPDRLFQRLVEEMNEENGNSYDLMNGLFKAMNEKGVVPEGKYKGVRYFNGGIFEKIEPFKLWHPEIMALRNCAESDWTKVNPAIFGSIFQYAMDKDERHEHGMHYTSESDIKMIVYPVIVKPWNEKIQKAETQEDYYNLLKELRAFKVLDPSCGSGNFLFIAFREMKKIESNLLNIIQSREKDIKSFHKFLEEVPYLGPKNFYGIDTNKFAVELAMVTMMVAKEVAIEETFFNKGDALPLDFLNDNIVCADALFIEWPEVDAIIGNPPFQSKNKMQEEFGIEYMNKLHTAFPEVPGRADFCVYWFYKAHKHLKENCFAGLVGTNSIRQNYSRDGSLDYIVKNGGEIIEAVTSKPWSGEAMVHVSIACWKKGKHTNGRILYTFEKDEKFIPHTLAKINSSLSLQTDVASAKILECNKEPKKCFQGQTQGHEGFLLSIKEAKKILKSDAKYADVLKPFLTGDELVGKPYSQPSRFVIDFSFLEINEASKYKDLFKILKSKVLPIIENYALLEREGKIKANGREAWLNMWWKMWRRREDMLNSISNLKRYISCSRVTQRPIFEFIDSNIHPNDALMVFAFEDDYSFGIIQSSLHWNWFITKCSSLGNTFRYTAETVWDTFPFPQTPTEKQIKNVAKAAVKLRDYRNEMIEQNQLTLRTLYKNLESGGKNKLRDLQTELDSAVIEAYGFDSNKDLLQQLLDLNLEIAAKEKQNQKVQAPGLPDFVKNKKQFVTEDCIHFRDEDFKEGLFK